MNMCAMIVALACVALLGGCALLGPDAKVIDALGHDPATVCVTATTPYGVVRGSRANCVNCNVTCAPDGSMTVTSPSSTQVISTPPSGSFILVPAK